MGPTPARVSFPGSQGAQLAARLDLPAGPVRAYALFAHCFTCSKDLRSAGRIAAQLTARGLGVLRFDFTGLGASEGEFASTGFASNVEDLHRAAAWLREHHQAPQLLVGHSLGGAAVVAAAAGLPEVRAVATIGAPASTEHLAKLFEGHEDDLRRKGSAEVTIAGRRFTVRAELLDELATHSIERHAATLGRALLVLHSPIDNEVGIEHAAQLYGAARHPKSFVALDGADHLLSADADACFAAAMIGAWAERYLDDHLPAAPAPAPSAPVVVAETTQGTFLNHVVVGHHHLLADEPIDVGGFDAGPSPYDLIAAGLGACTTMTLRLYADRKGLPVSRLAVEVAHAKVHATDAADAGRGGPSRIDHFTRVLRIDGDVDDQQRADLLRIADRCPVHRTLESSSRITTTLGPPADPDAGR